MIKEGLHLILAFDGTCFSEPVILMSTGGGGLFKKILGIPTCEEKCGDHSCSSQSHTILGSIQSGSGSGE